MKFLFQGKGNAVAFGYVNLLTGGSKVTGRKRLTSGIPLGSHVSLLCRINSSDQVKAIQYKQLIVASV